jgi:aldehyde dehydrogenase (NAD+)
MSVALDGSLHPSTELERIDGLADKLRESFRRGTTRPLEWRRAQLRALKALLKENVEELVVALQSDLAKPTLEAYTTDVAVVVGEINMVLK